MRLDVSVWVTGPAIGIACGAVLWLGIDTTITDTTGIGLALSTGLAVAVAYLWLRSAKRRQT